MSEAVDGRLHADLLERARALVAEKRASGELPEGATPALDRLFIEVAPPGARVEGEGVATALEMLARFRFDPNVAIESRRPHLAGAARLVKRALRPIVAWPLRHLTNQLDTFHAAQMEVLRALVEALGDKRRDSLVLGGSPPQVPLAGRDGSRSPSLAPVEEYRKIGMLVSGRVFQLIPDFHTDDAIGNHARLMAQLLGERSGGFIVERAAPELAGIAIHWKRARVEADDLLVYHVAGGAKLGGWFRQAPAKKVIDYHNITPPEFFRAYDAGFAADLAAGRQKLQALSGDVPLAIAHSEYSRRELEAMGFRQTLTLPALVDLGRLEGIGNEGLLSELRAGKRERGDILFVSRVAPHKRQEGVIKAFTLYRRVFRPTARLFLVGGAGTPSYLRALESFIDRLGIEEVHLVGKVSLPDLASYYRNADLFLSMSEHEGFGIPWLEAMYFGVPVLSFAAGAIAETVGDAGVLFTEKRYEDVAALVHLILTDEAVRARLVTAGQKLVEEMAPQRFQARLR